MLLANNLSFKRGRKEIFQEIYISLPPKKIIHLKGRNGIGKTTLIKILVNMLFPTTGEIYWNGKWAPICGHYFWDNDNGAKLFCQKLGLVNGKIKGKGSILTDDAIRIGGCSDSDNQLFGCTRGCNDLKVGDHCINNGAGVCTKGQPAKVEIECGMLTVLVGF